MLHFDTFSVVSVDLQFLNISDVAIWFTFLNFALWCPVSLHVSAKRPWQAAEPLRPSYRSMLESMCGPWDSAGAVSVTDWLKLTIGHWLRDAYISELVLGVRLGCPPAVLVAVGYWLALISISFSHFQRHFQSFCFFFGTTCRVESCRIMSRGKTWVNNSQQLWPRQSLPMIL